MALLATGPVPNRANAADHNQVAPRHWAFQPIDRPATPAVHNPDWIANPIDAFVLRRLEQNRIEPSPEADRATLARRLSLDLTGLPPSPDSVRAFVNDPSPSAYDRLVSRLLESPHFGEQWARHWLDLARYADSDGYEKDNVRPWAWRYRDWVIQAINGDMPFDQFTREQLAGDLLENATLGQKTATGLHRNTLTNKEGGVDQEEFRCQAVVDRVNTTATIWLGLTVACAECHDHKYDPISQKEYYRLFAFFNNADEKDLAAPFPDELAAYESALARWQKARARLLAELDNGPDDSEASARKEALAAHDKTKPSYPPSKVRTLARAEKARATHIHERGDFLRPGRQVQPGTPAVLHAFQGNPENADRLALADWLLDPANPLTARVTVNRLWQHLFGRGLVRTPDDFGSRGEPPTHPELLDWLAAEFIQRGWSRRDMIRLIVTSNTYRQSSRHRPKLQTRDPLNTWLARQNRFRLSSENIRDAALAAGGLLARAIGGPGVRPPLPADIAALGYANSVKWKESAGSEKYRRGLYILFQRTVPYPMLTLFDSPDSNTTCTRRERSNTPLQALTLLNDPVFFECAQNLGRLTHRDLANASVDDRIDHLFIRCLSRLPSAPERARLRELHDQHLALASFVHPNETARLTGAPAASPGDAADIAALVAVSRVILNLDEFITRE